MTSVSVRRFGELEGENSQSDEGECQYKLSADRFEEVLDATKRGYLSFL